MKVSSSGYNYCHDSSYHVERPEGIGEYVLLIIRSPARIILNEQIRDIKGNNVIVYRKGTPQYFSAHNTEFVNDWVQFDLDDEELAYFEGIGIEFDTILEFSDTYALSDLVKLLFVERWSKNPNSEESKILLLRLLLLKLSDFISQKTAVSSQYTMRLTILRHKIYSTPHRDWSIETISKNMSMSPSYLHYTYKQMFGTSIKHDVITSRIERSKHLLANTDYPVATIAHMVGYENDVPFMNIFKKKTGFTPSQYRKSSVKYSY